MLMNSNVVDIYWVDFQNRVPAYGGLEIPPSYYFCDNEKDANDCAELVELGIKQATTHSLWWFQAHNETLPAPDDLAIVTDWDGNPRAIIKTTKVEIAKFKDINEQYAFIEGEGDKSLTYWKEVHWAYYSREMADHNHSVSPEMKLVCEYFETIWPKTT